MSWIYAPPGTGVVTGLPVKYTIIENSGIRESYTEEGPHATVRFRCTWFNHPALMTGLVGKWTGVPPVAIAYQGPYLYPVLNQYNMFCTSISSVEPFGKPIPDPSAGLPWLVKEYADVTAEFSRPPWQPADTGGYFEVKFNGSGQVLSIPGSSYSWGDGAPVPEGSAGVIVPEAAIEVIRYRMPFLPDATAMPLIGSVNNDLFTIGFNTYDVGTLLFTGMQSESKADLLGNITFTIHYQFTFRPIPWNQLYEPGVGWGTVLDESGNTIYPLTNLDVLP